MFYGPSENLARKGLICDQRLTPYAASFNSQVMSESDQEQETPVALARSKREWKQIIGTSFLMMIFFLFCKAKWLIDGLVQDCSISKVLAMEIPQSYTKLSPYMSVM